MRKVGKSLLRRDDPPPAAEAPAAAETGAATEETAAVTAEFNDKIGELGVELAQATLEETQKIYEKANEDFIGHMEAHLESREAEIGGEEAGGDNEVEEAASFLEIGSMDDPPAAEAPPPAEGEAPAEGGDAEGKEGGEEGDKPDPSLGDVPVVSEFVKSAAFTEDLTALAEDVDKSNGEINGIKVEIVEKENEISDLTRKQAGLQKEDDALKASIANLQSHISAVTARIDRLKKQKQLRLLQAQLAQYSSAQSISDAQSKDATAVTASLTEKIKALSDAIGPLQTTESDNFKKSVIGGAAAAAAPAAAAPAPAAAF